MPRLDAGDVAEALRLWREGRTIRDNALRKLEKSRTVPAADTLPQLDERRKQIRWLLRDAGPDIADFEPWGEWWSRCFDAVNQTPVVQKSAVPIDWKAIQDRDADVLEWFERLQGGCGPDTAIGTPKKFLRGWAEILVAVGEKNNDETRRMVKRLNELREGPISKPGRGSRPIVEQSKLLQWWNRLDLEQQDAANQREGEKLAAKFQHAYGREGTVVPEIGGAVKRRRKDRKSRAK